MKDDKKVICHALNIFDFSVKQDLGKLDEESEQGAPFLFKAECTYRAYLDKSAQSQMDYMMKYFQANLLNELYKGIQERLYEIEIELKRHGEPKLIELVEKLRKDIDRI